MKYFELDNYKEAMGCEDSKKWRLAMEEEMDSLHRNQTWKLVPRPKSQKINDFKWIFWVKEGALPSEQRRYKVRLVAKGFT